jgi:hypothetical protein
VLSCTQQALLAVTGLEAAVMDEHRPRENLLELNREGLASLLGYCAIFEASVACGALFFARTSSGSSGGSGGGSGVGSLPGPEWGQFASAAAVFTLAPALVGLSVPSRR